ncbi:MAG: tRNA (N(6)-L-threonylcarbamoyladenosine(37)-C(2))-methylthiotransferase MtaB [bacterium]
MSHHLPDELPSATIRIAFWTLGCRLNQYDTEGMKTAMRDRGGIEIVPWDEPADVYVLNSCTVTGKADQECRRLARQVKRRQPESKVVVAGCYAQTQPERLSEVLEVDGIIGNNLKDDVAAWLPAVLKTDSPLIRVQDFTHNSTFTTPSITDFGGRSRAFVKVQDGCDLRCAYCLIWRARGPSRSRPLAAVLAQVTHLVSSGYREIVLAGIHLGFYGRDLDGSDGPDGSDGLIGLLRAVLTDFPDLRIRLSSLHPDEITPELLGLCSDQPRIRPHLHISLQSGSDAVLHAMRRPYDSEQARQSIEAAALHLPACGIGADIIVGFPGESDDDFATTCAFVESLPFSYLHVFRYSPRPGTVAAERKDQVHPETVTERSRRLRRLAAGKREAFLQSLLGQWREAVVESRSEAGDLRQATTDNYAPVLVPDRWPAGSLVRVRPVAVVAGCLSAAAVELCKPVNPEPEGG